MKNRRNVFDIRNYGADVNNDDNAICINNTVRLTTQPYDIREKDARNDILKYRNILIIH